MIRIILIAIAIILVLLIIALVFGALAFRDATRKETRTMLDGVTLSGRVVTRESLAPLPAAVQRWLERSGVIGREMEDVVHLTQKGAMRTSKDGSWMAFTAEQWFTTGRPGFVWAVDVPILLGLGMVGRDSYRDGRGSLLIKIAALFTVADGTGKDVDQGTLLRYLAETCWFPTAALREYITWREIDSLHAEATMSYRGVTASGVFTFNERGDAVAFDAQRYYSRDGGATLEHWNVEIDPDSYRTFGGVRIGAKSTVTWKLKDGDFTWATLELQDIRTNAAALAARPQ